MIAYMEGIRCVNFIDVTPVVKEIQGVENIELAVPVNNTLVYHTAFLSAETQPCVLIGTDYFFIVPLNVL